MMDEESHLSNRNQESNGRDYHSQFLKVKKFKLKQIMMESRGASQKIVKNKLHLQNLIFSNGFKSLAQLIYIVF